MVSCENCGLTASHLSNRLSVYGQSCAKTKTACPLGETRYWERIPPWGRANSVSKILHILWIHPNHWHTSSATKLRWRLCLVICQALRCSEMSWFRSTGVNLLGEASAGTTFTAQRCRSCCSVWKTGRVEEKLILSTRGKKKTNASGKMFTALQSKYLFLLWQKPSSWDLPLVGVAFFPLAAELIRC